MLSVFYLVIIRIGNQLCFYRIPDLNSPFKLLLLLDIYLNEFIKIQDRHRTHHQITLLMRGWSFPRLRYLIFQNIQNSSTNLDGYHYLLIIINRSVKN